MVRAAAVLALVAVVGIAPTPPTVAGRLAAGSDHYAQNLRVVPDAGPVATTVRVEGGPCTFEGQKTVHFLFGNEGYTSPGWGTHGLMDIPGVPVDAAGEVRFHFTIPDRLEPARGQGGGRVLPGRYAFLSKPPLCLATFTVTDSS